MQTKIRNLNLDNRAELQLAAGAGVSLDSAAKTTQGDVTVTLGVPGGNNFVPTPGTYANMNRISESLVATLATLASGTMNLTAISLPQGVLVSTITFVSGTTAAVAPTNQLFGLYDSARLLLGATNNDAATAWNASVPKTLTLTTPFTTLNDGLYYLACMVTVSTTMPTLTGNASIATVVGQAPILNGSSNTGLTTTLPAGPATAITALAGVPYGYVG